MFVISILINESFLANVLESLAMLLLAIELEESFWLMLLCNNGFEAQSELNKNRNVNNMIFIACIIE